MADNTPIKRCPVCRRKVPVYQVVQKHKVVVTKQWCPMSGKPMS